MLTSNQMSAHQQQSEPISGGLSETVVVSRLRNLKTTRGSQSNIHLASNFAKDSSGDEAAKPRQVSNQTANRDIIGIGLLSKQRSPTQST